MRTIYCLIPVHNRLRSTQQCVEDLINQQFSGHLTIVVIDDGSTDGTNEYLHATQSMALREGVRIFVCVGDGQWWWSRCINEGLERIVGSLKPGDGVLLLNDDVTLDSDYVANLLEVWFDVGPSIVMSQLVDINDETEIIHSPISVDPKKLVISAVETPFHGGLALWTESAVAPGRGTLYPAEIFMNGLRVDQKSLPHYLADYELSLRASRLGYRILVAHQAKVRTEQDWGNQKLQGSIRWRLFAPQSPELLKAYWRFWRVHSPRTLGIVLVFRMFCFRVMPSLYGFLKELKLEKP